MDALFLFSVAAFLWCAIKRSVHELGMTLNAGQDAPAAAETRRGMHNRPS